MKKVIFNDEEYQEHLEQLNQLMAQADELPYPNAKELIFSILKFFDAIHREPLSRMMETLKEKHPEIQQELESDLSVRTMLGLYDLYEEPEEVLFEPSEGVVGFVPLEEVGLLNPLKKTEWLELGNVTDFEEKKLYPKNFEKINFLVSKVDSQFYALQNNCVDSILPIDLGKLEEHVLICPWHGCRYDLKTGQAENYPEKQLEVYPLKIEEDGVLKVGILY